LLTNRSVPAAAAVTTDKKEEKEEASPVEKKGNKRASVFGSLFKNRITSPSAEKSEKDAMTSSDIPPVSETAPKLEEPIENKPIDTAAVTAPVDTVTTPAAPATEEPATAAKTDKKGGFLGFIKKTEAKVEGKKEAKEEDKAAEAIAQDPVAAAAPVEASEPTATEPVASEATPEVPAATTEERPARDNKRRTSLFFNKKQAESSEADDTVAEPKREKSPLPGGKFIGQLVRRASKAIKSEGPKEKTPTTEASTTPAAAPATTEATTETPVATAAETSEAKPVEPVTEPIQSSPEPVATTAPEVKATA
jgi:hypothetical protein